MRHLVYLSIGSNNRADWYLQEGLDGLAQLGVIHQCSAVYNSVAVGFDGADFSNAVLEFSTHLDLLQLKYELRKIEFSLGRPANARKASGRNFDVDILLYDALVGAYEGVTLPRVDIDIYSFVLKPLVDIAPTLQDPRNGMLLADKWREKAATLQALTPSSIVLKVPVPFPV